ncbi:MAG: hypothetical protein NC302_00135 [Bacteroidales bacterium]|nr:hypothetical protein [Bacteroidales bacterium]MCM1414315.1 hypothetical protein [bacterium]MCM1422195.1 hypothetical protein [bacterium]
MKDLSYWEQFMATGKIEDFLAYKNAVREEEREAEAASGEEFDAGGHGAYRDGLES